MICLQCTAVRPGETQHEAGIRLRNEMLRRFCGIDSPSVVAHPGEKPHLADREDISFSVSHSGSAVICALSFPGVAEAADARVIYSGADAPQVGADVELVRDSSDVSRLHRLADRFFPEREVGRLTEFSDEEYPRAFCETWTALESFVKRTGEGFRHGFSHIDLTTVRRMTDAWEIDGETYVVSVTF